MNSRALAGMLASMSSDWMGMGRSYFASPRAFGFDRAVTSKKAHRKHPCGKRRR